MGCNNVKQAALEELSYITNQIKRENNNLEKERDLLKLHHEDRPEEEKDLLHDLRVMHNDLEKELLELKETMLVFMPIPDSSEFSYSTIKSLIEKITHLEIEFEEKSEQFKEKIQKKKLIDEEEEILGQSIGQIENQIMELVSAIQKQEWLLKEEGLDESQEDDRRKSYDENYGRYLSFEIKETDESKNSDESASSSETDKRINEVFLGTSEAEIQRELNEVQNELEEIKNEILDLELPENDILQMENYLISLQGKVDLIKKNSHFKEQILENQERIECLKEQKRKIKKEIQNSIMGAKEKQYSEKIATIEKIIEKRNDKVDFELGCKELIEDVEAVLDKAKGLSIEIKNKYCATKH